MSHALQRMAEALHALALDRRFDKPYFVPARWINPAFPGYDEVRMVNPYVFYRDRVKGALTAQPEGKAGTPTNGDWSRYAIVYNMFVRHTTAWDHDGDGRLRLDDIVWGFRETGTFVKSIAILPYLKYLGIDTIHLLPVTSIGMDGNKGNLGSPYAIRNPYELDPRLAEPCLNMDVEEQFEAFVDAAHRMGMRVVTEFVFRTAAKDSRWVQEHPEWFYWIDASIPDRDPENPSAGGYGSPVFDDETLRQIKMKVEQEQDFSKLPPPPEEYRNMFRQAPRHPIRKDGRYYGTVPYETTVRIPGAFADWPPDDVQPPWNDVTYLKLYDHPDFNYIAYNTIRMYDTALTAKKYRQKELWKQILNIIPYYQDRFHIDGVMIDMGHALPKQLMHEIIKRAREKNPDFAFWEENFALTEASRKEGYNIAMGFLWGEEHEPDKIRNVVRYLDENGAPMPFFATAETHNTPRAAARPGETVFSRMALLFNSALPGVLFIHQGFELGETVPVNTGLGFLPEDIRKYPPEMLPLFSAAMLAWSNVDGFPTYLQQIITLRRTYKSIICDPDRSTFYAAESSNPMILSYVRSSRDKRTAIAIVVNLDCTASQETQITFPLAQMEVSDQISGRRWRKAGEQFTFQLQPGEGLFLKVCAMDD